MIVWGEIWQNADILARVIQTKGYNTDCKPEKADQLIIASQRFSALSSDCELKNTNPIVEEFDKGLNRHLQPQKQQPVKKIKKE